MSVKLDRLFNIDEAIALTTNPKIAIKKIIEEDETTIVEDIIEDCLQSAMVNLQLSKDYTTCFCEETYFEQGERIEDTGVEYTYMTDDATLMRMLKNKEVSLDDGYFIRRNKAGKKEVVEILNRKLDCTLKDGILKVRVTDLAKRLLTRIKEECLRYGVVVKLKITIEDNYYDNDTLKIVYQNKLSINHVESFLEYPIMVKENIELDHYKNELVIYCGLEEVLFS